MERNIPVKKEKNSHEKKTDPSGFVSRQRRIMALMTAGYNLDVFRGAGGFDVQPGQSFNIDELSPDPTRHKGFDMVDGSRYLRDIQAKAAQAKKAVEKRKKSSPPVDSGKADKTPEKAPEGA